MLRLLGLRLKHTYFAFGLVICSELRLPELIEDAGSAICDIQIRLGSVLVDLADAHYRDEVLQIASADTLVTIAGVARYHVHAGCDITVDPFPGVPEHRVTAYLLGSVWGVVCHRRGLLPLHANAIELNGRVAAFAGNSGAGKSTLAAAMEDRGYGVLSDDICVVSFSSGQAPLAWPGIPRVRLWGDAATALGRDVNGMLRAAGGLPKYHIPIAQPLCRQGLPLACIYILDDAPAEPEIRRMPIATALEAVMKHTYRWQYLELAGTASQRFARNVELLAKVAVFHLPWQKSFATLDADITKLERHLRTEIVAAMGGA